MERATAVGLTSPRTTSGRAVDSWLRVRSSPRPKPSGLFPSMGASGFAFELTIQRPVKARATPYRCRRVALRRRARFGTTDSRSSSLSEAPLLPFWLDALRVLSIPPLLLVVGVELLLAFLLRGGASL